MSRSLNVSKLFALILVAMLSIVAIPTYATVPNSISQTERNALMALYNATDGIKNSAASDRV